MLAQGEIIENGIIAPKALDPKPFIEMAIQEVLTVEELIERTL